MKGRGAFQAPFLPFKANSWRLVLDPSLADGGGEEV